MFRRHLQDEYIRLSHTSSEDVFKISSRFFQDVLIKTSMFFLVIYLQDVFKRPSRPIKMQSRIKIQPEVLYKRRALINFNSQINKKSSHPEVVCQNMLLNFSQNSNEKIFAGVSFWWNLSWKPKTIRSSHSRCSVTTGFLE